MSPIHVELHPWRHKEPRHNKVAAVSVGMDTFIELFWGQDVKCTSPTTWCWPSTRGCYVWHYHRLTVLTCLSRHTDRQSPMGREVCCMLSGLIYPHVRSPIWFLLVEWGAEGTRQATSNSNVTSRSHNRWLQKSLLKSVGYSDRITVVQEI